MNTVAPKYPKKMSVETKRQIADINQIALNILEMEKLLNEDKNQ